MKSFFFYLSMFMDKFINKQQNFWNFILFSFLFTILYLTNNILFLMLFFSLFIYCFIFLLIIDFKEIIKISDNFNLNKHNETSFYTSFSNTLLFLIIISFLFFLLSKYESDTITPLSSKTNIVDKNTHLYISNKSPTFNLKNILIKRFFKYNTIEKNNEPKVKNNDFFNTKNNYHQLIIKNKEFDFINLFSNFDFINNSNKESFLYDDSLLDTFIVKDSNGDSTSCFVDNLPYYFYEFEFEIFIKDGIFEFKSPITMDSNEKLKNSINTIIQECKK